MMWVLYRVPGLRGLTLALQRWAFRVQHASSVDGPVRVLGYPIVTRAKGSSLSIGSGVTLISTSYFNSVGVPHPCVIRTLTPESEISVGPGAGLSGATICAARKVSIGARVLIGAGAMVLDTDLHPVNQVPRREPDARTTGLPVVIGDDVFIGAGAVVLKGVTVGDGAVVGAMSVVTSDVEAGAIVAGNPARPVGKTTT